jgi:hypothetical protein
MASRDMPAKYKDIDFVVAEDTDKVVNEKKRKVATGSSEKDEETSVPSEYEQLRASNMKKNSKFLETIGKNIVRCIFLENYQLYVCIV